MLRERSWWILKHKGHRLLPLGGLLGRSITIKWWLLSDSYRFVLGLNKNAAPPCSFLGFSFCLKVPSQVARVFKCWKKEWFNQTGSTRLHWMRCVSLGCIRMKRAPPAQWPHPFNIIDFSRSSSSTWSHISARMLRRKLTDTLSAETFLMYGSMHRWPQYYAARSSNNQICVKSSPTS